MGDFVIATFPGELTVPIGLNIKRAAKYPHAFVAGYTNGYIYYAPTAEQLKNVGGAQEDSDCLLDPAWQNIFETKAGEIIRKLMKCQNGLGTRNACCSRKLIGPFHKMNWVRKRMSV